MLRRGALIVLEGSDKVGKSTQCHKLKLALDKQGTSCKVWKFPDRSTKIGKLINDYLSQRWELEDHAIHLLFTANRWECNPQITKLIEQGTTVIVDRYAYSGVAYSAAKSGFALEWCTCPEKGLLKPDAVIFLNLKSEVASERLNFGKERYEVIEFQERVTDNFSKLKEENWVVFDADQTVEELHKKILFIVNEIIENIDGPLNKL